MLSSSHTCYSEDLNHNQNLNDSVENTDDTLNREDRVHKEDLPTSKKQPTHESGKSIKAIVEKFKDTDNMGKEHLQNLINKMETQLVHGGQAIEEKNKEQARKIRAMQLKLKMQRK